MDRKKLITGYDPRQFQAFLHGQVQEGNVLVCHRGFGKTVFLINHILDDAVRNPFTNPLYAYIAPTYGQAKRIAWEMLKYYARKIPLVETNEADLRLDIIRPERDDKARIMLLGAEKPGSIRGSHFNGVGIDEYSEMTPEVFTEVVNPGLRQRKGWVIFIGTPKGMNHFYDILQVAKAHPKDWFHVIYKASETGILTQSELNKARAVMSEEEYMQEFECSFTAALVGAYYGNEISALESDDKKIGTVPYDPALSVDTYWDLGIDDSTVIWFGQQYGAEYRWIDYIENSGESLHWYAKQMINRQYIYRGLYLPHDAAARDLSTGKSREETLRQYPIGRTIILPRHDLADGINAVRMVLPKCRFDKVKCKRGLDALKNYERKWDAKNKIWSTRPKHNWASHGADGFRTFAMSNNDDVRRIGRNNLPRMAVSNYDVFSGGDYGGKRFPVRRF